MLVKVCTPGNLQLTERDVTLMFILLQMVSPSLDSSFTQSHSLNTEFITGVADPYYFWPWNRIRIFFLIGKIQQRIINLVALFSRGV